MRVTASRYLALARNALGMELAWLSEHTGPEQVLRVVHGESRPFGIAEGDALPWEGSFCARVLDQRLPSAIPDARANPVSAALPVTEQLGIGSYVGSPVRLRDGSMYGMLCCISRGPHANLPDHKVHLLEAIAASLAAELADELADREQPDSAHHRIRRAIEGDGLHMVAQPIVDISSMQSVGVEMLTRFEHPPAGPDVWFAEAAELGLGVLLEMAAVRAALELLDHLPGDLYLSVNVSPPTLASDQLLSALAGVDASRIVVELTEHSAVADYDELLASLDLLRRRGVRIAIDDAGAGYASFRHILSLHPDIIKFDRHMVTGLDVDPARRALVSALVSFAGQIGATLVAEGVETSGELDTLLRLGVACGQGYHLARPAPLPLPEITARPSTMRRVASEESRPAHSDAEEQFEERVMTVLREVVTRTRLDASYLSVWDPERETLMHRLVYDPTPVGIREGLSAPWRETPCYRCREAGVLWTADIQADLPSGTHLHGTDLHTFISVPIQNAAGEMIGTLCAAGREHRYLSDPVVEHIERLSGEVAEFMRRTI